MIIENDNMTLIPNDVFAVAITEATRALIEQVAVWARDGKILIDTDVASIAEASSDIVIIPALESAISDSSR